MKLILSLTLIVLDINSHGIYYILIMNLFL